MKFSIRDVLLVTVIVALALGWGLDHWRVTRRADQLFRTAQTFAGQLRWKGVKVTMHENGDYEAEGFIDD